MNPALDALNKLHAHFLAQAAEVGQAIAILERSRTSPPMPADIAKTADAVLTETGRDVEDWEPVEIISSGQGGTSIRHPSLPAILLEPHEVSALADGATVWTVGRQLRLIGGKIHILVG